MCLIPGAVQLFWGPTGFTGEKKKHLAVTARLEQMNLERQQQPGVEARTGGALEVSDRLVSQKAMDNWFVAWDI